MGKGVAQPAIWLLLFRGLTAKQIIALGYKENTVYNYAARFPEVKAIYKEKYKIFKNKNNLVKLTGVKINV